MEKSINKGISFGLTSGVITTIGLIIGLFFGTNSKLAVIAGVITIAFADSLSDAFGIHISEEADKTKTEKQVWKSTLSAFLTKFFLALSFLIPLLLLPIQIGILVSIVYGILILAFLSYFIAKNRKEKPFSVISEHILTAIIVIITSYIIGGLINKIFN